MYPRYTAQYTILGSRFASSLSSALSSGSVVFALCHFVYWWPSLCVISTGSAVRFDVNSVGRECAIMLGHQSKIGVVQLSRPLVCLLSLLFLPKGFKCETFVVVGKSKAGSSLGVRNVARQARYFVAELEQAIQLILDFAVFRGFRMGKPWYFSFPLELPF